MRITNNKVNLCDSCKYTYPDCSANKDDVLFGDGVGDDNICCCNRYRVKMPDNTVSEGVYEQVAWERDVAIEQLKELGYGFGEKIRYDDNAVSRKEVLRMIDCINDHNAITPYKSIEAITEHLMRIAKGLSTVMPKGETLDNCLLIEVSDEDSISRKDVIDGFCTRCDIGLCDSSKCYRIEWIRDLPPATPKQKIGEWRINSDGYYPYCSECKEEPKNREMTKYCPNCGAKMGGV